MPLAVDYPFLQVPWTIFTSSPWDGVGFVIMCPIDNFRRPDFSGGAKGAWTPPIIVSR